MRRIEADKLSFHFLVPDPESEGVREPRFPDPEVLFCWRPESWRVMFSPRAVITFYFRVLYIPLRGKGSISHHQDSHCYHAVDVSQITVIDFIPVVAQAVIVGIVKGNAQGMRGHPL